MLNRFLFLWQGQEMARKVFDWVALDVEQHVAMHSVNLQLIVCVYYTQVDADHAKR